MDYAYCPPHQSNFQETTIQTNQNRHL